jgi:KAP-like P-loop domain-containing protein
LILKVVKATPGGDRAVREGEAVREFLHQAGEDRRSIPLGFRSLREAVARNPLVIVLSVAFALICAGLAWALRARQSEIALIVAWLGPTLSLVGGAMRAVSSWRARIVSAWKTLDREVRSAESRVEREREILREQLQTSAQAQELRELEEKQRRLESEAQELRRQIGFTADYASVADLVQARLTKAEYEGELGPLHRVQRDLQELTQALCPSSDPDHLAKLKEQFPRGPARIVLFIDDLDRCPPDRVVEVLEAVQLLVKTPLFVVVLAMDVRYITRALEKVYKDILLRRGKPSGLDYIEKIIQLPYSVRPIDATHVEHFLRGQMEVQAEAEVNMGETPVAPGPNVIRREDSGSAATPVEEPKPVSSEVVVFSLEELGWLRGCCEVLPLSPRAVKRVVNALKLLKIVWFRPNRHIRPEPEVQQAFVALLALSAAYPDAMRTVFSQLAERMQPGLPLALQPELQQILDSESLRASGAPDEVEDLKRHATLVPAGASLLPHLRLTLELVRSLSFVAEIGYDPAHDPVPFPS